MKDERERLTFLELAEGGRALFLDTGVLYGGMDLNYRQTIGRARKFTDLDYHAMKPVKDSLSELRRISEDKSVEVYTTSEVLGESDYFRKKLRRKFEDLEMDLAAAGTNPNTGGRREVLRSIVTAYEDVLFAMSQRDFGDEVKVKPIFRLLEKVVINVSDKVGINGKHVNSPNKVYKDLRTDERLVASAIYHSVVNGRASDILCKDSHIARLVYGSVASMILSGNYKGLLGSFSANPVTVYYCNEDLFSRECDSSDVARNLGK